MSEEHFKSIVMDTGIICRWPFHTPPMALFYGGVGAHEEAFGPSQIPYCVTLSKDWEKDMQYAAGLMVEEKMIKVEYSKELDLQTVICRSERRKGER